MKLSQGRLRGAFEDADTAVRLAPRGSGRDVADALLHRAASGLAGADAAAASADLEASRRASESARGVHRPFEEALLNVAQSELLILRGDAAGAATTSELARATFERGSHEIRANAARLLTARCLSRTDGQAADKIAVKVEAFARERGLLSMQVDALTLRGLLLQDLARLDEGGQLASRIGSPWVLASIAKARFQIYSSRRDEKAAAAEHRAFLSHMSILSAELEPQARVRVLAAAEKGDHPFVI